MALRARAGVRLVSSEATTRGVGNRTGGRTDFFGEITAARSTDEVDNDRAMFR